MDNIKAIGQWALFFHLYKQSKYIMAAVESGAAESNILYKIAVIFDNQLEGILKGTDTNTDVVLSLQHRKMIIEYMDNNIAAAINHRGLNYGVLITATLSTLYELNFPPVVRILNTIDNGVEELIRLNIALPEAEASRDWYRDAKSVVEQCVNPGYRGFNMIKNHRIVTNVFSPFIESLSKSDKLIADMRYSAVGYLGIKYNLWLEINPLHIITAVYLYELITNEGIDVLTEYISRNETREWLKKNHGIDAYSDAELANIALAVHEASLDYVGAYSTGLSALLATVIRFDPDASMICAYEYSKLMNNPLTRDMEHKDKISHIISYVYKYYHRDSPQNYPDLYVKEYKKNISVFHELIDKLVTGKYRLTVILYKGNYNASIGRKK